MEPKLTETAEMVRQFHDLFVNRRAYTVQSMRPHPEGGRHYYFRPVDRSLTHEVLRRFGGAEEVERIRDIVKLSMVKERMEDLARGVARLKRAIETVGEEPYRQLCIKMSLPSDSIDDIPTREVLKRLVELMEKRDQRPAAECVQS